MGLIQEFKEFAIKGNAIDLAVGVVIGAAFSKIVDSIVKDIIMPPIGFLINGINFENIVIPMGDATIKLGSFLQNTVQFIIIAFVIFMVIKQINRLKKDPKELPPTTKECAFCKEGIAVAAIKCKFCTADQI